jgi:peptide/nickel transport system substrate-binding protein
MTKHGRAGRWLLGLAVAAGLAACGGEPRRDAGTTFVYVRGKTSPGLDPAEETDGESAIVIANVYDTLVQHKPGSATELEPALATRWEWAGDRRSVSFTLREGVRFHDGRPCDADAVVASFERQRDPRHRFRFVPAYAYWDSMFQSVAATKAVDPKTVRFEFTEDGAPSFFLHLLAMFSASVVSPGALERGKEFVARNPVGTGAFRFGAWDGDEIVLEANPEWWGGRPKVDRVALVVEPDVRKGFLQLETGKAHGIDNVDAQDVGRVQRDARMRLHEKPGMNVCYLTMNNDRAPFTDARVRRAVALALDKARIVATAYDGRAIPARTVVPPTVEGHAALPDQPRDVAKARALLAEAGASALKVTLSFPSNPRPYMPRPQTVASQVREDLAEAGIDVTLRKEEWNPLLDQLQNGEHQMALIGWSADVADADNFLYVLLDKDAATKGSANNYSFYRSEAFHELVVAARRSHDPAERARLYERAQRLVDEDAPLVPLAHTPRMAATLATVESFAIDAVTSPRFAWVTLQAPRPPGSPGP